MGEAKMNVAATDLDGHPLGEVDLSRSADGRATVNDRVVLAMRPLGSRVALIVSSHQYYVPAADYWRVMSAASKIPADDTPA
jgi:hypothetical protein